MKIAMIVAGLTFAQTRCMHIMYKALFYDELYKEDLNWERIYAPFHKLVSTVCNLYVGSLKKVFLTKFSKSQRGELGLRSHLHQIEPARVGILAEERPFWEVNKIKYVPHFFCT